MLISRLDREGFEVVEHFHIFLKCRLFLSQLRHLFVSQLLGVHILFFLLIKVVQGESALRIGFLRVRNFLCELLSLLIDLCQSIVGLWLDYLIRHVQSSSRRTVLFAARWLRLLLD